MSLLTPESTFSGLAISLRDELLSEYSTIQSAYYASRWRECGLAAGRFCEVAFTVIQDIAAGTQSATASKPRDFIGTCRKLEADTRLPDGLRFHALRFLPVLYDIRNKRDIGHVNGDIDPSQMDANLCMTGASWILAELVRVLHDLPTETARQVVSSIVELKTPIVWNAGDIRRLAVKGLTRSNECILLIASNQGKTTEEDLMLWMGISHRSNLRKILNVLHENKLVEAKSDYSNLRLMPLGAQRAKELLTENAA